MHSIPYVLCPCIGGVSVDYYKRHLSFVHIAQSSVPTINIVGLASHIVTLFWYRHGRHGRGTSFMVVICMPKLAYALHKLRVGMPPHTPRLYVGG